ncbi:hypothetical protein Dsin_005561 [Dipteronia sinensis]|uniref:Ulp1-like peptidase n=1 Tax=Dipteronia sinensis TaxID=43782 RepID=A0AAE0EF14_9ROSI|nr:hypothetical protein Dsin_005561 [Dipteronia sinensis]
MTLVGKDDRTTILYWALELVDDLEAFNKFPWGSFIYARTFNSLSTCLHGREDKLKIKFTDDKLEENVDGPVRRKGEKYNVYGFLTAFQVWAIEAIPKWVTLGYAVRVNNVAPRILNWQCTGTPSYADIQKTIFKFKNIKIEGRWGIATKDKKQKQFKHETYQWDNTMMDYVKGKYPLHASEHWKTVNTRLVVVICVNGVETCVATRSVKFAGTK